MLSFALLILCLVGHVACYGSGAPDGACESMTPSHGGATPQSGTSGVVITTSVAFFNTCDATVSVTLSGGTFKGFLCQARPAPSVYTTTGMIATGTYTNKCSGSQASITHAESSDKTSVTFEWSPYGTPENFYVVCTIVRNASTFWVAEQSSQVSYTGSMTECSTNSAGQLGMGTWINILMTMISAFNILGK